MKTAIVVGTLLLAALVGLATEPVAAEPLPCDADLGTSGGAVWCSNPVGHGCVWATYGDYEMYCTG